MMPSALSITQIGLVSRPPHVGSYSRSNVCGLGRYPMHNNLKENL
jgi:hypothetical protein